jgi:hypothetical protein
MTAFRTKALVAATAAALSLGISGNASADSVALGELAITNFVILHSNNVQYVAGDFTTLTVQNSGQAIEQFGANPVQSDSAGPVPGPITLTQVCDGAGCPPNNTYNFVPTPGFVGSRSDADLTGSIIAAGGATANQVSETILSNPPGGNGTGSSTLQNGSEFTFSLAQADSITFQFDGRSLVNTTVDAGAIFGSQSTAGTSFSIRITNLETNTPVFAFVPTDLNFTNSRSSPGTTSVDTGVDPFSSTSPVLLANTRYGLSILSGTSDSALLIIPGQTPEPATLLLVGAGLLGIGALRRRRSNA